MNQGRLAGLLLSPSLFSIGVSSLLSAGIILGATWTYITPDSALYNYLFGPYGLTTVLERSSNALAAINGAFDSRATYYIAVAFFAVFVGLIVFIFLQGVDHVKAAARTEVNEVVYVSDTAVKATMKKEAELRIGLRAAALIVWICYIVFFIQIVVPYCILLGHIDTTHLWSGDNIRKAVGAFAVLLAAFHVHVIFMRLLVLRPRFFGSSDVVIDQGGHP